MSLGVFLRFFIITLVQQRSTYPRSCGYNLVVLDDIDPSDGATNRILERFLVSVANNDEHKSNGTVVVATANTGGSAINRLMLDRHRQLLARERVTGDEVREELRQQAADIPLVATLADYNIPVKASCSRIATCISVVISHCCKA